MSDLVQIAASELTLAGARPLLAVLESLWPVKFIDRPGAGATTSIVDAVASPQVDEPLMLHMPAPSEPSADSRLNYRARRVDSGYRVRPLGHTIALEVPQGIDHVVVEAEASPLTVCGRQNGPVRVDPHGRTAIPVVAGDTVTITRRVRGDDRSTSPPVYRRRTSPHLLVRRLLIEARDRLLVN